MVYSTRDVVHAGRLADKPCGGLLDVVGRIDACRVGHPSAYLAVGLEQLDRLFEALQGMGSG